MQAIFAHMFARHWACAFPDDDGRECNPELDRIRPGEVSPHAQAVQTVHSLVPCRQLRSQSAVALLQSTRQVPGRIVGFSGITLTPVVVGESAGPMSCKHIAKIACIAHLIFTPVR